MSPKAGSSHKGSRGNTATYKQIFHTWCTTRPWWWGYYTVQQGCHCRAGGRVIRQQKHYHIVILFLLADPGDEPHFGRSVLPAPLMSSYNHQVGPARSRPADFPRLIGGALVHGAAPLALATSSELWNLPRPYPVLSWEKKSRIIVRIISRQVSNVWRDNTIWRRHLLVCLHFKKLLKDRSNISP